nr:MAG TPA: hypothetical protein [Herelleviridae sp.]
MLYSYDKAHSRSGNHTKISGSYPLVFFWEE